jgi:hypothetical protein
MWVLVLVNACVLEEEAYEVVYIPESKKLDLPFSP